MGKTAFIYPGQGAQYIGMGRDAAERHAAAKRIFDEADAALDFDLSGLIFSGNAEELKKTENTQPALLTVCVALSAVLAGEGISPDIAAGLSIGEYAAHVSSGTFSFTDAVRIVRLRGKFMQEEVPEGIGGMAAVMGLGADIVEECCKMAPERAGDASLIVEPSNYNCPGQTVISGHNKAVEAACALCRERGAKRAAALAVSAPFHCGLLRGAGDKLAVELEKYTPGKMRFPVVSNVTAELVTDPAEAFGLLVRQVASPVRWEQCVRRMHAEGVSRFVEIGPGKTLTGFVKKIVPEAEIINVSDAASLDEAVLLLA